MHGNPNTIEREILSLQLTMNFHVVVVVIFSPPHCYRNIPFYCCLNFLSTQAPHCFIARPIVPSGAPTPKSIHASFSRVGVHCDPNTTVLLIATGSEFFRRLGRYLPVPTLLPSQFFIYPCAPPHCFIALPIARLCHRVPRHRSLYKPHFLG